MTKNIGVALLPFAGFGLALPECKQWRR